MLGLMSPTLCDGRSPIVSLISLQQFVMAEPIVNLDTTISLLSLSLSLSLWLSLLTSVSCSLSLRLSCASQAVGDVVCFHSFILSFSLFSQHQQQAGSRDRIRGCFTNLSSNSRPSPTHIPRKVPQHRGKRKRK